MKKRFLSAMAMLLGANVTWAGPGASNAPAGPGTPATPSMPASGMAGTTAPAPSAATSGKTGAGVAAPRSLQLPEARALPSTAQAPAAQPPAATPPAAPATTQPAAPAPAQAAAPAQNGRNGAAAPKVDLRDCHIGPEGCYWASAEYLLWWTKDGPLPTALATTSTTPGPGSFGAIGQPGTSVVIGNSSFDYGTLSGARFELGGWLNERHTLGIDAALFFLKQGEASAAAASNAAGAPLLARPIFNVLTNTQSVFLVSMPTPPPGALAGGIAVTSQSQFWGLESNLIRNLYYSECFRADLTFGFRNLNLEENLSIAQSTSLVPGGMGALIFSGAPAGAVTNQLVLVDRFGAVNHFYGGQIGGRFQWYRGCWVFDVITKVALGVNHEAVNILGQTNAAFAGGGAGTATGGLLALNNSNYGTRINDTTNYFAVAPEVKLSVGYQLGRHLRAMAGWDFLYLSGVARPGNHIDTAVNPTLVPASASFAPSTPLSPATGPFAPNLSIRQTDFWAQGINFGLLFTY